MHKLMKLTGKYQSDVCTFGQFRLLQAVISSNHLVLPLSTHVALGLGSIFCCGKSIFLCPADLVLTFLTALANRILAAVVGRLVFCCCCNKGTFLLLVFFNTKRLIQFLVQLPTLKPCPPDAWWLVHALRLCTVLLSSTITESQNVLGGCIVRSFSADWDLEILSSNFISHKVQETSLTFFLRHFYLASFFSLVERMVEKSGSFSTSFSLHSSHWNTVSAWGIVLVLWTRQEFSADYVESCTLGRFHKLLTWRMC